MSKRSVGERRTVTYQVRDKEEGGVYEEVSWEVEPTVEKLTLRSRVRALLHTTKGGPKPQVGVMGAGAVRLKDGSDEELRSDSHLPEWGEQVIVYYPNPNE